MEKKKISLKEIGLPKLIMLLVIGMFLILSSIPNIFPGKKEVKDDVPNMADILKTIETNEKAVGDSYVSDLEMKFKNILKKVSGIGDVEVMITLKSSKEKITLKDSPYTQESLKEVDGEGGSRANNEIVKEDSTVLVTTDEGSSMPYIIQEIEPTIEGVLIIAQGGDNAKVIKDVVEAAEVLFGIPIYKVKVMKMSDR